MSDQNNKVALGELGDIKKPLLDGQAAGGADRSPDASDAGSDKLEFQNKAIENMVRPLNEDTVSGFTQANYMNPQKVFKNDNQQRLDNFLRYFSESAGTKGNERSEGGKQEMEDSEVSEGAVVKSDRVSAKNQISKIIQNIQAPDDANKCTTVPSHKEFIKKQMKTVQNPRRTYFDLSRKHFKDKYPDGDNLKQITVRSFLQTTDMKQYLKNLSIDIIQTQQGNMPVIKTFEENAYDSTKFIKAVKFYDYRREGKDIPLTKGVDGKYHQFLIDEGWLDESYRTLDVSLLYFGNYVLFYSREERWLQLQAYDVINKKKETMIKYQIEMPKEEDVRYHPIFSKEFGIKTKNIYEKSGNKLTLSQFLDQQFVFCQEYSLHDRQGYGTRSLKMFSMQDTGTPIGQYGAVDGKMAPLSESIQHICHIKMHNDQGVYYNFVAIGPFSTHIFGCPENLSFHTEPDVFPGNNEQQLQKMDKLLDPQYSSQWKHDNLSPFMIHQNPQFIVQKDTVTLNLTGEPEEIEQYYYLTNDNQFMLVYPNYASLSNKKEAIFQLAKKNSYKIVGDDDYDYIDDFKAREKDYRECKYVKIAHVCHDGNRSKNHMKLASHLQMIIYDTQDQRDTNQFGPKHRLILSTDQEVSNIYVYKSAGDDQIQQQGHLTIYIYNYANNIDKAQSLMPKAKSYMLANDEREDVHAVPKLPKQIQTIMNLEKKYAKRMSSKKAEEDASCYYMHEHYKNVISSRYCVQTQSKSLLDQKTIGHELPTGEQKQFCIVEGTQAQQQQFYNIRIKHEHMNEGLQLQMYYRSKSYYVFLFSLVNEAEKYDRKQSFFFIRKNLAQIDELSQDNHKSLISQDQDIYVVLDNDLNGPDDLILSKYLKLMLFRDLVDFQKEDSRALKDLNISNNIHMTMETLYDFKSKFDFLPFIYQEKKSLATHHLLVLDINVMQIVGRTCINSNLEIRKYLRKSEAGFAMYTLTRTSEKFDQKLGMFQQDRQSQVVKYQITHQYYLEDAEEHPNPAKCTIEMSEFLVHYSNQSSSSTKISLIGKKQMLLSDVAQFRREQSFHKLFVLPFYDNSGKIKGSQLVLQEDDQVIKITDQDKNKIYHHQTDLVQFGQQKFLTDKGSHDEYILLVSVQLKQKVYMKGNLETSESYYILNKIQKKMMSMQLAKFEYFVLTDDFDKLMRDEFYQAQEVLQGKTICDICLNFPKEIAAGLRLDQKQFKEIDGSMIDEICLGDQQQIDFYKKIGLCEDNLIIQPDFNFVTTLRLAIELDANQSVKLLLKKIFEINSRDYQECMMLDLPKILDCELIRRVYPFFERDYEEFKQIQEDQENIHIDQSKLNAPFCNFEDYIVHPELPPFSNEQVSYHVMQDFIDYHNTEQELLCEVILKDPYMQWDVNSYNMEDPNLAITKRSYEVEHSLIDFQKLIIGEKIRGYQEDFVNIEFNDQHLASLLYVEGDNKLDFYKLETIQKLVDFQFIKTQQFLSLIMRLYVFGFLGPFILSITFDNYLLKNLCYILCFVTQCFLFLFELVQMRQYGLAYIQDFWNCIDLMQFTGFIYLFISKLLSQFSSDSFLEILISAGILILSINKMLYFVRIYDQISEMIILIEATLKSLLPFACTSIILIFSLSKIYHVLHMGVNDPDNLYGSINSDLMKLFMQTIKQSTGDKTPPTLDEKFDKRLEGSQSKIVYIFFLEVVWAVQQTVAFTFGLYATASAISNYEKFQQMLTLLKYQSKAKFNEENFQILNLIQPQAAFKVIFFQIDKDIKTNKLNKFEGTTKQIEKAMQEQENKKMDMKKDDDLQRKKLMEGQKQMAQKLEFMLAEMQSHKQMHHRHPNQVYHVHEEPEQQQQEQQY